jgi:putative endonuclease
VASATSAASSTPIAYYVGVTGSKIGVDNGTSRHYDVSGCPPKPQWRAEVAAPRISRHLLPLNVVAYVYVIENRSSGWRYIGSTVRKPVERLKEHNAGRVIATTGRGPFILIYQEELTSEVLAIKRERFFKTGKGRRVLKSLLSNPIRARDDRST